MKKIIISCIVGISCLSGVYASSTYLTATEHGHAYKVMKVTFDGNSKIVVAAVESGSPAQSLETLTNSVGGTHAINGGFFCPNEAAYAWCVGNTTDLVRKTNGVLVSKRGNDIGTNKSVFGFDIGGIPSFVRDNGSYLADTGVEAIFNGIGMPTLIHNGVNVAVLNDAMNADAKQSKAGNKSFICSTKDTSTVYMGYIDGVTFSSIADYLIQTFACYNAILLDNGGSKAMIVNNAYVTGPGRNIMDAFVVIDGNNIGPIVIPDSFPYTAEELQTAISRMYDEGLTKYTTISDYRPFNTMTREEASKFFGVFAKTIFAATEKDGTQCAFKDIAQADRSLVSNITQACSLGIFKGSAGNFLPKQTLTTAQAIAVLMRIMVGMMDETTSPRYTHYISKAAELGLLQNIAPEKNITRGEAAILLYKAYVYAKK